MQNSLPYVGLSGDPGMIYYGIIKNGVQCKLLQKLGSIFHSGQLLRVEVLMHCFSLHSQEMVLFAGQCLTKMQ